MGSEGIGGLGGQDEQGETFLDGFGCSGRRRDSWRFVGGGDGLAGALGGVLQLERIARGLRRPGVSQKKDTAKVEMGGEISICIPET